MYGAIPFCQALTELTACIGSDWTTSQSWSYHCLQKRKLRLKRFKLSARLLQWVTESGFELRLFGEQSGNAGYCGGGFSVRSRGWLTGFSVLVHCACGGPSHAGGKQSAKWGKGSFWKNQGVRLALTVAFLKFGHQNLPCMTIPLLLSGGSSSGKHSYKGLHAPYQVDVLYAHNSSQPPCLSFSQWAWRHIYFPRLSLAIVIKVKSIRMSFCPDSVNLSKRPSAPDLP